MQKQKMVVQQNPTNNKMIRDISGKMGGGGNSWGGIHQQFALGEEEEEKNPPIEKGHCVYLSDVFFCW